VIDADTGSRLADYRVDGRPVELLWSADGELLAVRMKRVIRIYGPNSSRVAILATRTTGAGQAAPPAAAFAPDGRRFAFVQYDPVANRSAIYVETIGTGPVRRLFGGPGHFSQLAWSPDGRWLLVAWPDANQLFFVRTTGPRKVRAVADVRRQFGGFPHLAGWCCAGE
jgi:dipeptidyl aminopeptidase/acylaminoacyl peptidase